MKKLTLPASEQELAALRAGDALLLSGRMLTGRDAAHKRMIQLINDGKQLPVDINGQAIYYVGPCPAVNGMPVGSCGPTTSGRMDNYAPTLIARGLKVMIGKGLRAPAVVNAMKEHGAVYLAAVGGAGALLAKSVKECRVLAFDDLGTEAIHEFIVEDFPVIVAIDAQGNNLFESGVAAYKK